MNILHKAAAPSADIMPAVTVVAVTGVTDTTWTSLTDETESINGSELNFSHPEDVKVTAIDNPKMLLPFNPRPNETSESSRSPRRNSVGSQSTRGTNG